MTRPKTLNAVSALLICFLPILLVGCWSLEAAVPSITEPMVTFAQRDSLSHATLDRGRDVYLSRCIECHGVRSVSDYSQAQWDEILGRMVPKSHLDEDDAHALRSYIRTARAYQAIQTDPVK